MSSDHHLSEFTMHGLKHLGIFRQLLPDIFGSHKDVNQNTPVLLHFEPLINNHINSSEFITPVLNSVNEILDILSLCFHAHEVESVGIKHFHHVVKGGKDVVLLVLIKEEYLFGPVALDDLELLVNLELLLSNINNFLYFLLQLVEFESQDIVETEGSCLVVEVGDSFVLELFPVPVFHVVTTKRLNQGQHDGHVADFLPKTLPALNKADFFVDTFDLGGKDLVLVDENISFNLSPELLLPVVVLQVDEGDQIPESFKVLKVRVTLFKRLIVAPLKLEEVLEFCVSACFLFKLFKFEFVLVDGVIAGHDVLDRHVFVIVVGEICLKLSLEVVDLHSEGIKFLLDLDGLITNNVDDVLLDFGNLLLSLIEPDFRSLNSLGWFLFSLFCDLNAVLL